MDSLQVKAVVVEIGRFSDVDQKALIEALLKQYIGVEILQKHIHEDRIDRILNMIRDSKVRTLILKSPKAQNWLLSFRYSIAYENLGVMWKKWFNPESPHRIVEVGISEDKKHMCFLPAEIPMTGNSEGFEPFDFEKHIVNGKISGDEMYYPEPNEDGTPSWKPWWLIYEDANY